MNEFPDEWCGNVAVTKSLIFVIDNCRTVGMLALNDG